MLKRIIGLILTTLMFGCASMTITKNKDGGCSLKGWGGGKGSIEGICSVDKGMIELGGLQLKNQ
ncbi:MAG: hypothetical protein NG712_05735 [Omnitrophica bacterium]|nr:hypothetical protein [Candidatus Omnitrophota bacterium]